MRVTLPAAIGAAIPECYFLQSMELADSLALTGVIAGEGGPFGAVLDVYDAKSGHVYPIARANNQVLMTGMATDHAESQVLTTEAYSSLYSVLNEMSDSRDHLYVALHTSGQSCGACKSKTEIVARKLIQDGLLPAGHMLLSYGATWEDTRDVAGFNDLAYIEDMRNPNGTPLVAHSTRTIESLVPNIRSLFQKAVHAGNALAVMHVEDTGHISARHASRESSPLLTAELQAMRAACASQKQVGYARPFDLRSGTLYTFAQQPGPLTYTTAQWSNVGEIITVQGYDSLPASATRELQETQGLDNRTFFNLIAAPDNTPGSAVTVLRVENFANRAQNAWRKKLSGVDERQAECLLYNGAPTCA